MLTTCEDAILHRGTIPAETTGVYFRMVWHHGMAHSELVRYAEAMWELSQENPEASRFPEWVVQHVDQKWITGYPSADEAGIYRVNVHYVQWLLIDGRTTRHPGYLVTCSGPRAASPRAPGGP